MDYRPKIPTEGKPIGKLLGIMKAVGYNPGGDLLRATITKEYPNLTLRIDGDSIEIDDEGIICNPDLLQHTQTVKIDGVSHTIEYPNRLTVGTKVYVYEPEHQQLFFILMLAE